MSRMWADLTTDDFKNIDVDRTVAVLPVGAIEQHGPHLPVGVDAIINAGIVKRAVETMSGDCPALFLPMLKVGKSDEHLAFPGTLTLSHETLARVWYEIAACVHRAGVRKILFFNSHGGQPQLLEIVCRDLRAKLGLFSVAATWSRITPMADLFSESEIKHGIHGGQIETSMMLHLEPQTVKMQAAENFVPLSVALENETQILGSGAVNFGWQTQDLHPSGACGNASLATAELGKLVIDRAASRLVLLMDEMSRYPLSRINMNSNVEHDTSLYV